MAQQVRNVSDRTGSIWCVRHQPGVGQEPPVEASIHFARPRSRPSPRNDRFPASKLTAALPQGGQEPTLSQIFVTADHARIAAKEINKL